MADSNASMHLHSTLMADSNANMHLRNHKTPTKTTKGGWHAAIFITCVEFAERFVFQGLAVNLITYLTNVLNEPTTEAVKNINTWIGVSSLFPLLGGFIADSYLGRFTTIVMSSLIYLLGMVFLTLSVSVLKFKKLFFIGLYVLSVGDGGHRPCVQTFAADQFDDNTAEQRDTKSSFFNWWYLSIVLAATSAVFFIPYLQDNFGWTVGLGVQTTVWAIAVAAFFVGIKRYKKESPKGSPFTTIAQVFVAASRKRHMKGTPSRVIYWQGHNNDVPPEFPTLEHTEQYSFLDKAMIIDEYDASSNTKDPWRLCSLTQVEEVKLVLRLIPVWLSCLMFAVVQSQPSTFFNKQGSTLERSIGPKFKVPPASLQGFVGLVILCAIPIYDTVFVPFARKFTGHRSGITVLQRIGVGLVLSILNMVVSALVEAKRVGVARHHNLIDKPKAIIPMSIWWLLPQYSILAISDAFTIVGLQELFYDQMPEAMRSLGAAAYVSITGFGSFVSNAIIIVVVEITSRAGEKWLGSNLNKAHLNYFYWVLAGLSTLNLCVYVWIAKRFVYRKAYEAGTINDGV